MKRALVILLLLASTAHADTVWLAVPSIDGAAGLELGGERQVAPQRTVALAASMRRTASSDYDAVRLGAALEYRHYFRSPSQRGWLAGARLDVATSRLSMSDRPIGTVISTGLRAELGYRVIPWRSLTVTALIGLGGSVDRDLDGRLPTQAHRVLGLGLDLGWMF